MRRLLILLGILCLIGITLTAQNRNPVTELASAPINLATITNLRTGPQISVVPDNLNFGMMNPYGSTQQRTITITNIGDDTLNITSIEPSLPGMGTITVSPTSIPPIEAETQEVITFTYDPETTSGAMSGTITINSDDAETPAFVINISAWTEPLDIVTIGTGTANSSVIPVSTGWNFSYAQTIYLPTDLTRPGLITSIFYHYNGHSSWAWYDTWTMFMGHTSIATFSGTAAWSTAIPHGSLTEVFAGTVGLNSVVPSGGWVRIELDTPFEYNGVDNLVVGVLQNISGYSSSATFQSTTSSVNRSWRIANDSTMIDPDASTPTSSFSHTTAVPNIKLILEPLEGPPELVVTPINYTFPVSDVNFTSTQHFTMMNRRTGVVEVSSVTIAGDDVFTIHDNIPATLEGLTTSIWSVSFSPIAAGEYNATVSIVHDSGEPISVAISATCVDNSIFWSGFSENFNAGVFPPARWTRGTTSPSALSATIQPTGTSEWTTQTFSNETGHAFGRSAYFNNYMVRNEWLITPQIILASGDYSVDFDVLAKMWSGHAVAVSTPNDKRFVVLAKRVSDPWSVSHIIAEWNGDGTGFGFNGQPLDGSYADLFSQTNEAALIEHRKSITLPSELSEGGIQIAFIGCSTLSSPDTRLYLDNVTVSRIVSDAPLFSITPGAVSINLGTVLVGQTINSEFTIRNIGVGDGLDISNISLTGADEYTFSPVWTDNIILDSDAIHQFTVIFTPEGEGIFNATLTITYEDIDGPGGTHIISFTANVLDHRIVVFPHTETFTAPIAAGHPVYDRWSRHQTQFNESGTTTLLPALAQTSTWTLNSSNWGVWNFMNQAGHDLGTAAGINIWSSGIPSRCNWLVSPHIVIPDQHTIHLNFKYARSAYSSNATPANASATQKFLVIVSTDGGATWDPENVIARWDGNTQNHESGFSMNMNAIQNFAGSTTEYYDIDIPLTGLSGTIRIAFYADSQSGGDFNLYIDDFHLIAMSTGEFPLFSINPVATDITIPTTIVSESHTRNFTITNIGGGDGLIVNSIEITGHDYFRITDDQDITEPIPAGESIQFAVIYEPVTEGGPHTATLTIEYVDNDGPGTHTVELTANSVDHRIFLTPDTPYIQSFIVNEGASPTAGHELFDRWSRFQHTYVETAPTTLPAPIAPATTWWQSISVWGVRNFSNNASHTLGRAGHINIWGDNTRDWLVTPTIVVPDFHDLTIDFRYARSGWSGNTAPGTATATQKFMVIISTDNGATWENANVVARWDGDPANHASGVSMNMNSVQNFTNNTGFHEFSITLTGYSGEIRIAFYGESLVSGGADFNFYIDDIELSVTERITEDTWAPPLFQSVVSGYDVILYWWSPRLLDLSDAVLTTIESEMGSRTMLNKSVLADIELPATRDLLSYRIYRDGSLVHTMPDISTQIEFTWTDTPGSDDAVYTYGVRAVYDYAPSPANEIEVGIYTAVEYPWTADLSDLIVNLRFLLADGVTPEMTDVELLPSGWTRFATELGGENNPIIDKSIVWWIDYFPGTTDTSLNLWWGWFSGDAFADMVVSPTLNFEIGYTYNFSFEIALETSESSLPDDVRLAVVLSTDNGVTWSESNIQQSWIGSEILAFSTTGQNISVPLGTISGLHKIGFYIEQNEGDYDMDLWIRNIQIERSVSDGDREVVIYRTGLRANYPNPFNPETTIVFTVGAMSTSSVTIDIYNILGQHVRRLVDNVYETGEHKVVWNGTDDNGRDVASGIYFYRMKTGEFSETRKMILIK